MIRSRRDVLALLGGLLPVSVLSKLLPLRPPAPEPAGVSFSKLDGEPLVFHEEAPQPDPLDHGQFHGMSRRTYPRLKQPEEA